MKSIIVLFLTIFISSQLYAEKKKDPVPTITVAAPCTDWSSMKLNLFNSYGEIALAAGEGDIMLYRNDNMHEAEKIGGETVVFLNPETSTYTLVVRFNESGSLACALSAGKHFFPSKREIPKPEIEM